MTISCFSIPFKYPNSLFSFIWCFCCLLSGLWRTLWSYHHQPFSFCTLILHISLPLPSFVGYPLHLLEVTKEHNPSNYPPVSGPPVSSTSPSLLDYAFKLLILKIDLISPSSCHSFFCSPWQQQPLKIYLYSLSLNADFFSLHFVKIFALGIEF